uniref:Uncharacterized protein n=1 Tax=Romanomermis culicivorax TaxID=13658 RepID=A0A915INC6_ROMCU
MPKDKKQQKRGLQPAKDKEADCSLKEPVLTVPIGEFMNPLRMVNSKVSFRASVLHRIIARAEKRLQEQHEKPVSAKSKDKAGMSSNGGQSSELQAMLKAEFAAQRVELAASIAALTTRLNKI